MRGGGSTLYPRRGGNSKNAGEKSGGKGLQNKTGFYRAIIGRGRSNFNFEWPMMIIIAEGILIKKTEHLTSLP